MVEVFKTNMKKKSQAEKILRVLQNKFFHLKINFDLEDCDKILRVEGKNIQVKEIIRILKSKKCQCEILV
jgi:hypothetical protein